MAYQTFQEEYMQIPPITRAYTTSCVLTTLAVQLDILTPFQLYFNPELILRQGQVWRLVTNFLFFGTIGFNFLFNMIFTYRYCRMLEEGSFRGRTADFFVMFVFGGSLMILVGCFMSLVFLGQAFTIMLVYVWSRRNPYIRMNFFGLVNFHAPYLPWVLLLFSLLLGNSIMVDAMGMLVGHIYYYLEDVFPRLHGGFHLLKTPRFLKMIFDGVGNDDIVIEDSGAEVYRAEDIGEAHPDDVGQPQPSSTPAGASQQPPSPPAGADDQPSTSGTSTNNQNADNDHDA